MLQRTWLTTLRGNKTHQETADLAGIDRSFYTQIESGIRSPSVETAKKIADVLSFDWTIFFNQESGDTPQLNATGTDGN
jgi:transcriptional regulator with XRE-family HTH domain